MSKYFANPLVRQPNFLAVDYHRSWIKEIKNTLGSKCTFLQHVREVKHGFDKDTGEEIPDNYFVEARFLHEGKPKNIKFQINGTISDVGNENYLNLKKDLLNYARTEGII